MLSYGYLHLYAKTNQSKKMKKKYLYVLVTLLLSGFSSWAQTTTVSNKTALQNGVNSAAPGQVFILADGTYNNFNCSFTREGTADNPIIIKAQTVGGVTFTGASYFAFKKSAHIVFEGFVFDCTGNNTLIKLEASNNIRITRNVFEQASTSSVKWIVVVGTYNDYTFQFLSHHNRIDHNIFKNKFTAGNFITIDGTYNQTQTENYQSTHDRIDHNYFYNNSPRVENEKESIRIGNSQLCNSSGYTVVEFNLFEDCDGDPEIVSVKSNDNIVRHNTFKRNYGTVCLRQGNRNRVEGNYFFGADKPNGMFGTTPIYTGGIRIYGTEHVIVNNYFEGLKGTMWEAPIVLTQGDAVTGVNTNPSLHYRAERISIGYNTLVNNDYGIEIGYAKSDGSYSKKLQDIYIFNNLITGLQNSLVKFYNSQSGEVEFYNNLVYPTGSAQVVTGNPAFTTAQAINQNPGLVFDGTLWKAGTGTPVLAHGYAPLTVADDIDGHVRPALSNPGADYYSTQPVTYMPLTVDDVGPYADDQVMAVIDEAKTEFKIYPNPTTGIISLKLPAMQADAVIEVYNIHSQLVMSKDGVQAESTAVFDMSGQSQGMYFIKIIAGDKATTLKFMKQ